jgi:hypothetical protein
MSTPNSRKRFNMFKKVPKVEPVQEPEPFITASQVYDIVRAAQLHAAPQPRQGIDPFVLGFTLGMVAGGVAAGYFTPGSDQLRQHVGAQSRLLKDQAENIALQAKTTAQEVLKRNP